MPFRPELNFLYLYLQNYLHDKHGIHVERGDHRILTKPLLEKIHAQIRAADVIIGDVTGRNPNVFYELGIAHAHEKPVILMTQDPPTEAPTDIRHLEFIVYDMSKHQELLIKIDNAVQNVFMESYETYYIKACELLRSFNSDTGSTYQTATLEQFQEKVMRAERTEDIPNEEDGYSYTAFLLTKVLLEINDIKIMQHVIGWLDLKYGNVH
jgi:hypothetical protein